MTFIDFRIRPAGAGGADDATARIDDDVSKYVDLYRDDVSTDRALDQLLIDMEEHDVVGVVQAEYEAGQPEVINAAAGAMLKAHPDRFVAGIATADPTDPAALDQLIEAHEAHGLKGWVWQPAFVRVAANDERCYPIYEHLEKTNQIVTLHTGTNFSSTAPIDFGRPTTVDRVACDFPNLTIVCNHGGWPWVMETMAVLWKHENVYADFGAIAPKYMAHPGGGWAPVTHWMNTQVSEKVLFGTDWPMLRYGRVKEELPLLELRDEALAKYTYENGRSLLKRIWDVELA